MAEADSKTDYTKKKCDRRKKTSFVSSSSSSSRRWSSDFGCSSSSSSSSSCSKKCSSSSSSSCSSSSSSSKKCNKCRHKKCRCVVAVVPQEWNQNQVVVKNWDKPLESGQNWDQSQGARVWTKPLESGQSTRVFVLTLEDKEGHPWQHRIMDSSYGWAVNGRKGATIHVVRGRSYQFKINPGWDYQGQSDYRNHHRVYFSADPVGGPTGYWSSMPSYSSQPLDGTPAAAHYGVVTLNVTNNLPSVFYYTGTQSVLQGGTIIVHEVKGQCPRCYQAKCVCVRPAAVWRCTKCKHRKCRCKVSSVKCVKCHYKKCRCEVVVVQRCVKCRYEKCRCKSSSSSCSSSSSSSSCSSSSSSSSCKKCRK